MSEFLWWKHGVIYQIYPRSFADSNGDGTGDLQGLIDHLDYLAGTPDSLGIDAIWLSPIYPSPGHDFGYDVSSYCEIDPLFGDLQLFRRLVDEAHRRGIRIILDLVLNHTSHLHPWFVESRASRNSPKRSWYLWQDPTPDMKPPNHWQGVFGGPAWTWDERTGQYYYHMFLPEQPDLNWRNPEVRAAIKDVFRFWLELGVDGFRLDVVNAYFKDEQLRENPACLGLRPYDRQIHLFDQDRPELLDVYQELRSLLDEHSEAMMVGEVMGNDPALAARYCGNGRDALHLAFNFHATRQPWNATRIQQAIVDFERLIHPHAWPCHVLSNHDLDRHATRFGGGQDSDRRARVAATLLLTLRGTPFLYYGEELGLQNTRIPRRELVDPPGKAYWPFYKGRDGARTPMPWHAGPHAGFSSSRPWLRLNADHQTRNVAVQQENPDSIFHHYRQLLALRRQTPALHSGTFRPLLHRPRQALVYARSLGEHTCLVALNFSRRRQTVTLDEALAFRSSQVLHSTMATPPLSPGDGRIMLEPFQATIWNLDH
jgi:alpha-glucosidase